MTLCVVHQDHEAAEGWLCCSRAWGRMAGSLRQIPGLVAELHGLGYVQRDTGLRVRSEVVYANTQKADVADQGDPDPVASALPAGPLSGLRNGAKVSGTPGHGVPIRVDSTDLTAPARRGSMSVAVSGAYAQDQVGHLSVATELEFWASDWADLRNEGRPFPLVPVLCSWLLDRLDWACQHHYALGEFAADVQRLSSALYGACGKGPARPKVMEAVCPGCGYPNMAQPYPEAYIECTMPDCGRVLTPTEYEEMVRDMRQEIRAQDVLTVLAGGPVDVEKLEFAVITHGYTESPAQTVRASDGAAGRVEFQQHEERWWPFDRGEVIVLNRDGREPFGEQRKPSKWPIGCERFKTLDEALARRFEVLKTAEDAA